MRSFSKGGLGAVTAAAMATSTFPIAVASVLAAHLIDEFDISRAEVGFLVTASGLVGAVASPFFGRLTDRLGAVRSVVGTLAAGGAALAALALSPNYAVLIVAAVLTGFPNGWGNPSTNALIVDNVPPGSRGVLTGIKQSGVQVGFFLGGMLLPLFAGLWSWRLAVLAFLVMPLAGLLGMIGHRDHQTREERHEARVDGRTPVAVRWIAVYGFISGLATQALISFLPLFANEDLGWSESAAGWLISIVGLTGIAARLMWPRVAERTIGHGRTLRILAWLTTVTAILLWLASIDLAPDWVLVPGVLFLGGGAVAWNAVGMLAVMDLSPHGLVGKGTGVVLFGFLFGLAIGPPIMGYSVDTLGSYGPGWLTAAALLFVSGIMAFKIPSGTTVANLVGS
jgi:MFS family permease